jgi:adenylate kinase
MERHRHLLIGGHLASRFPVIYLTGAPATGKSTLARNLAARFPAMRVFAYSEELRHHIARKTRTNLSEDQIRELSGTVVTAEDIRTLDQQLVQEVAVERLNRPFLIDSHPVTKEGYGFRVTGFDVETLRALSPDFVVCLYTSPEVMRERIKRDAMGRPLVTEFEARMHTNLQTAVATQYGILLGTPVYLIDSAAAEEALVETVAGKAGLTARQRSADAATSSQVLKHPRGDG